MLNFISILSTCALIFFLGYFRISKSVQEISINLLDITEYRKFFEVLLFSSVFLTLGYLLVIILKNKTYFTPSGENQITRFLIWIKKYNIFYNGYGLIFEYLSPKYTTYLVRFTKSFLEFSPKINVLISFFCLTAPRLVILFFLIYDIFVLKQLHYYFFSLLLLIIPLVFRFFVFIFTDLSGRLLPQFQQYLVFGKPKPIDEDFGLSLNNPVTISVKLKPEHTDIDLDDLLFNFYYPIAYLKSYMMFTFLPQYNQVSMYTLLFYYTIHSFCWIYVVCYV